VQKEPIIKDLLFLCCCIRWS